MAYEKSWKSHKEQVSLLASRNMNVGDEEKAIKYLEKIGYYRLSGYFFPFRESAEFCSLTEKSEKPKSVKVEKIILDQFKDGTCFSKVIDLYVFDKRLRHIAMDALERIEVAIRSDIAYTLGAIDRFAYANPEILHPNFSQNYKPEKGVTPHHEWLGKNGQLISRSKEDFVKHNKSKYGLPLAIWVVCEVWDFGAMSTLYSGMRESEQDSISLKYGISNGRIFSSWLRSLNYLRNVCAHHSRLWNRNIIDQPKLPDVSEISWTTYFHNNNHARARCFLLLKIAHQLMRKINPNSTWEARVLALLESFPDLNPQGLNLSHMGAPENWKEIWKE